MTIVSAFISNVNKRSIDYINNGITLLSANIPKVIFVDELVYPQLKEYENETTKIIQTSKSNIYLYKYNQLQLQLNTTNLDKDTLEYLFIMNNKTEWMKEAIQLNMFNTSDYVWVDFGIKYIFKCPGEEFVKKIEGLNKQYSQIRIGSIWNLNHKYNVDIYTTINWYFAGGVFGGNKDFLLAFADLTKKKCLSIMEEKKTLMWEVNVWYLVYLENKHLFDPYSCDHNSTLVEHY
jgi:hypothetical protein